MNKIKEWQKAGYPRLLAVLGWTGVGGPSIAKVEAMLHNAIDGLLEPLKTPKPATIKGEPRSCWGTVARAVEEQGGKLLAGWSVVEADLRPPQSNPLARIVLNAHAVLEKDGEWYETIPERYTALGFIPGPVPAPDAYIEFFDDEASAEGAGLPDWSYEGLPYAYVTMPFRRKILISPKQRAEERKKQRKKWK
jgi:hypothetical protein